MYWERKGSLKLEPFRDEVEYMASRGYFVYIMVLIPRAQDPSLYTPCREP